MNEQPANTYSPEHPGHAEPDRYLDDEGRCTYCGRSVWEAKASDLERQLAEVVKKGVSLWYWGIPWKNAALEHEGRLSRADDRLRESEAAQAELRGALGNLLRYVNDCDACWSGPDGHRFSHDYHTGEDPPHDDCPCSCHQYDDAPNEAAAALASPGPCKRCDGSGWVESDLPTAHLPCPDCGSGLLDAVKALEAIKALPTNQALTRRIEVEAHDIASAALEKLERRG